jgi:hypothetical protein
VPDDDRESRELRSGVGGDLRIREQNHTAFVKKRGLKTGEESELMFFEGKGKNGHHGRDRNCAGPASLRLPPRSHGTKAEAP